MATQVQETTSYIEWLNEIWSFKLLFYTIQVKIRTNTSPKLTYKVQLGTVYRVEDFQLILEHPVFYDIRIPLTSLFC